MSLSLLSLLTTLAILGIRTRYLAVILVVIVVVVAAAVYMMRRGGNRP